MIVNNIGYQRIFSFIMREDILHIFRNLDKPQMCVIHEIDSTLFFCVGVSV